MSDDFQLSRKLQRIIDNTGKPISDTGLTQADFDAVNLLRKCNEPAEVKSPGWRGWLGAKQVDPNRIGTSPEVLAAISYPQNSVGLPKSCEECGRGLGIIGTDDRAICPIVKKIAEAKLRRSVRATEIATQELADCSEMPFPGFSSYRVIIDGNLVADHLPRIYVRPDVANSSELLRETYLNDFLPGDEENYARNLALSCIYGYRTGDEIILVQKPQRFDHYVPHIDPNTFNVTFPDEFRYGANTMYALQTYDLVTRILPTITNKPKRLLDLGAGNGILALKAAHDIADRDLDIVMVDLNNRLLAQALGIARANAITGNMHLIDRKIQQIQNTNPDIVFGNLGLHYGEDTFSALMYHLTNSPNLRQIYMGGFLKESDSLQLPTVSRLELESLGFREYARCEAQRQSVSHINQPATFVSYVFIR